MVVDDSRAMRMILSRELAALGFEVTQAASGTEALKLLEPPLMCPSLVLVDWNMPGITGLEFVEAVRTKPEAAATALLMVTTETGMGQMVRAMEAGANEYLMKPFTREMIADKLRILGLLE
ncbi:response regulator [Paludibaculum fermentans]|uniref:response regulator n=1 Tax=Paludibaculum fermentans TaxID=1473598 RepID=UPI003EC01073